jgi:hypothetical protein
MATVMTNGTGKRALDSAFVLVYPGATAVDKGIDLSPGYILTRRNVPVSNVTVHSIVVRQVCIGYLI